MPTGWQIEMPVSEEDKRRIEERYNLVVELRNKGFVTAESISNELKIMKKDDLNISPESISRDLRRLREKGRNYLEDIIINGEFVVEFHESLEEYKRIKNRCSEKVAKAEAQHELREIEINNMVIGGENLPTEADKLRLKLQNDAHYHSVMQNNERIGLQALEKHHNLFTKTEVIWALKKWVKENNPKEFNRPALQEVINSLEEKKDGEQ